MCATRDNRGLRRSGLRSRTNSLGFRWLSAAVVIVAIQGRPVAVWATQYPIMYWSDRVADTIQRADADGSNAQVIVSGLGEPRGIDLDLAGGKIYWADNGTNKIQRANLDGTQIEDLVISGLQFPAGIALDIAGGKMYWADESTQKIQRANLDGSGVQDLVTNLGSPYFVALDLISDKIYWTDFGTDKIQRANLDGSQVEDLVTVGLQLSRGIALDLQGGKMYWADRGTDMIQRANLDGSQIETLVTIVPPPGVDAAPHGVALDVANSHMYFVDNGTVKIQRANLDGANVVDVLTADSGVGLMRPWQIVLDLGPPDGLVPLQAGDANQDLSFDQQDVVQVIQAGRYRTGNAATWGEGDWNGAPGGHRGNPPPGDGLFNQIDVIAALSNGLYRTGPYGSETTLANPSRGSRADLQQDDWTNRSGSRADLRESQFQLRDFRAASLLTSAGFGPIDSTYVAVPEPSSMLLMVIALMMLVPFLKRDTANSRGCRRCHVEIPTEQRKTSPSSRERNKTRGMVIKCREKRSMVRANSGEFRSIQAYWPYGSIDGAGVSLPDCS